MKINLAKSAGFCFGVKRAIEIALKTIKSASPVYMLGEIVHNEEITEQLKRSGIKKVKKLVSGKNRTFLIRAHGVSIKLADKARGLGFKIVDATCPMVKEIHKIASELEKKGYAIIVIGDKRHDEVRGIIGQLKRKAIIIEDKKDIDFAGAKKIKKAAIVVQSTQNIERVEEIVNILKPHIKELKFFNTICRPTNIKQQEIKKLPLKNDIMIIIGSKTSANTRRLYEISKSLNRRTFWIQSKHDLRPEWFKNVKNVGISAGASTPDRTIKEISSFIRRTKAKT